MQIGNILPGQNASGSKDGNLHRCTHIGDDIAHGLVRAKMSAGLFSLDNNCSRAEFLGNLRKLCRRDNRNDRRTGVLAELEHIAGKSRTGDDEINPLINRSLNGIRKVACRDHLIDADDPIGRKRARKPNLIAQFLRLHAGGRDESDTALVRSGGCEPCRRDSNRHTALYDGDGGNLVANPHLG